MTVHRALERLSTTVFVGGALFVSSTASVAHAQLTGAPDQRFTPAATPSQARFGHAVDAGATRAIVGGHGDDQLGFEAGAAWIFERVDANGDWVEVAKLVAYDGQVGDQFGYAVALDGDRALVGAHGRDEAGVVDGGIVHVLERAADGTWSEVARLAPAAPAPFAHFGWSVDLEGDRALVGAVSDSTAGVFAGAAYVFERAADGTWSQVAQLLDPTASFGDSLGHAVALEGDAAFAASLLDDDAGDSAGAVHAFVRDANGVWSHAQTLTAAVADDGDRLGQSLAVDGDRLVAGTWIDGDDPGRAHLFERDATSGAWVEQQVLVGPDGSTFFGFGVAADLAGDFLVVGARRVNFGSTQPGMVRAYERDASGVWQWIADVAPDGSQADGRFGSALAISGPRELLVGAHTADGAAPLSGAAFSARVGRLMRTQPTVSIAAAGASELVLFAGPENARSFHAIVGSFTGTAPVTVVDGVDLPLVWDDYTQVTVVDQGGGILEGGFGLTDGAGRATAHFHLPTGLDPALAGLTLWHAAVVVSPPTFWPPALVTDPVGIELVP